MDGEKTLADYFNIFWKHKWLIAFIFLLFVVVAVVFSLFANKVYRVESILQVGIERDSKELSGPLSPIEDVSSLIGKINGGIYNKAIQTNLNISEQNFPQININNSSGSNVIKFTIDYPDKNKAEDVLHNLEDAIIKDHQAKIDARKEFLQKESSFYQQSVQSNEASIQRMNNQIKLLQIQEDDLAVEVATLEKNFSVNQDTGSQFALFSIEDQLSVKKQDIERQYKLINDMQVATNNFSSDVNSLNDQVASIVPTQIILEPRALPKPVSPNLLVNVIIAGVLGIFVGVLIVLGIEYWDKNK